MTPELEQMRMMIADARSEFWAGVNVALADAREFAQSLSAAIGEVSAPLAFDAWRRETAKRLRAGLEDAGNTETRSARSSGSDVVDGGDREKGI